MVKMSKYEYIQRIEKYFCFYTNYYIIQAKHETSSLNTIKFCSYQCLEKWKTEEKVRRK